MVINGCGYVWPVPLNLGCVISWRYVEISQNINTTTSCISPSKWNSAKHRYLLCLPLAFLRYLDRPRLKTWIIMLDLKNIGNQISRVISKASFYRDVGVIWSHASPKDFQFHASLIPSYATLPMRISQVFGCDKSLEISFWRKRCY